jgi:hypothetical protein
MSNLSFLHAGTFGDTVLSLNVIKILGGGDLYIQLNGMDDVARAMWGGGDAGCHAGRYTQRDLDFIWPLLEKQSYIKNLQIWENQSVSHDLRNHHKFWARRNGKVEDWAGNATECYALVCKLDIIKHRQALWLDPWLTVDNPIVIPGKPVVINRTGRHIKREHYNISMVNPQWTDWIENHNLEKMAIFVGTPKEHQEFCDLHQCNVEYRPVSDMLELARIIQGAEQFIGNQSMALTLALGLGKTYWCEIRLDYETTRTPHGLGDAWFPRLNGQYF